MKFTIRDLLWLTVIVALGVGWWLEHRQYDDLKNEHRLMQMSHDILASSLEEALDERVRDAVDRGEPVLIPIYADEPKGDESLSPPPNP